MRRRSFLRSVLAVSAVAPGCSLDISPQARPGDPRLRARPGSATLEGAPFGLSHLGLSAGRDGVLYVPRSYTPASPVALVVLLHGAGGISSSWFGSYGPRAEDKGFILLAPDSRAGTWDAVRGAFGPDVTFIDAALADTFKRVAIDPQRIALAGFSDGASYAISLGVANGDLFSRLVAFSPGFIAGANHVGKPRVFISHGVSDGVLPIATTSRTIVPRLRNDGYEVTYQEFAGGHEVPAAISDQAMTWLS